jgi:hypothetical protein
MKIWSFDNGNLEVVVSRWNIKESGSTFYTVSQVFKDGFGSKMGSQLFEFQTFHEASELAESLINKTNLDN